MRMGVPELKTNTDTNFLKLIAIASMLADHVGAVFFRGNDIFHGIGRLAFPLFLYCTFVGAMYTHDILKYILRLGAFAVASQLPYVLAFQPTAEDMVENWYFPNVIFTLLFSVILIYGMQIRKWWLIVSASAVLMLAPLDYGYDAFLIVLILYLLRNKPVIECILVALYFASAFFTAKDCSLCGLSFGIQGFAVLSVPLMFCRTHFHPHISKYFFYAFYPGHLLLLFVIRILLDA